MSRLIMFSKAENTWQKHIAAWNLLNTYSCTVCYTNCWPLDIFHARNFTVWALTVKNLQPSTVRSYLYSIRIGHSLNGIDCQNFVRDDIIKMTLAGAENVLALEKHSVDSRPPMTLNCLLILGHRISEQNWKLDSKQVVWTVFLICFFTSCRMGELVSPSVNSFDPSTTLLWKHVTISEKCAKIFVPYTKTKGFKGHLLEMFPFHIDSCCPLSALQNWKELAVEKGIYSRNLPVFSFISGKLLTTAKLNSILGELLKDLGSEAKAKFSCHSFRAAIPSLISSHPDKSFVSDIKEWGEWDSPSYLLYTKLDSDRKKFLFNKISVLLCDSLK